MYREIVTHDGKFHADDVFAVATLLLLEPGAVVTRTRSEERIKNGDIVVDVGGVYDASAKRFDHHQVGGAGIRENTIPYAAFGLVWKEFGEMLTKDAQVACRVEEVLVVPVDANDNGVDISIPSLKDISVYDISDAIRSFVPTWLERDEDMDTRFKEAVSFAKKIVLQEIGRAKAVVAGEKRVEELYQLAEDKRLIILDEDYSWKGALARHKEPLYVVHPQNESWRLYCVRDNPHLFVNRKDLPKAWAGLKGAEFSKVTGVPDVIFAHRNCFMAVAKSREGVLKLAALALTS